MSCSAGVTSVADDDSVCPVQLVFCSACVKRPASILVSGSAVLSLSQEVHVSVSCVAEKPL
ncbi:hypothetical protein E2C01_095099 [Portunus trituberculatus]|uniref:Uncharacterized protein n=1 Tax=Portunus trituberculatus TaxID=210409 RepID=A0A5B7JNY7_PORTR|nr:hypothetical protein [Portunus trituberculatus]